jgi:hypothetical protein
MTKSQHYDSARQQANSYGIDQRDRQQVLLDDLRVEIARLADAVEQQNELLAERRSEADQ